MEMISLLVFFLVLLSLCYTFYAAYCTWVFFKKNRPTKTDPEKAFPPVSIIKPVAEVEEGTLENFLSFCDQDYPDYEIIFSLSQKDERVILLLENLTKRFPEREIQWVIADHNGGPNYKVGKLVRALQEAKNEILVISDGDMRVKPNYLRQIVPLWLQEKVGLVTCLYRGTYVQNIFSALQSLSVQTDFIPNVLLDHQLEGISYAFGATILTSKEILTSLGGLETLREYLADDYQIGNRIHQKGYVINLSPYLVDHIGYTKNLREHLLHHLRWAITLRICRPVGYFASIITHSVSLGAVFLILEGFSSTATVLFLFILGVRLLSFSYLNKRMIRNPELTRYFWLIPFNDLLNTILWFLSLLTNTVYWRGRRFRVLRGGRIVEL